MFDLGKRHRRTKRHSFAALSRISTAIAAPQAFHNELASGKERKRASSNKSKDKLNSTSSWVTDGIHERLKGPQAHDTGRMRERAASLVTGPSTSICSPLGGAPQLQSASQRIIRPSNFYGHRAFKFEDDESLLSPVSDVFYASASCKHWLQHSADESDEHLSQGEKLPERWVGKVVKCPDRSFRQPTSNVGIGRNCSIDDIAETAEIDNDNSSKQQQASPNTRDVKSNEDQNKMADPGKVDATSTDEGLDDFDEPTEPYPMFVPIAFKKLTQQSFPRNICLRAITNR